MTQVERKVERVLRAKLIQQVSHPNIFFNIETQKESVKNLLRLEQNFHQKKLSCLRPSLKMNTEMNEEQISTDATSQNQMQEVLPLINQSQENQKHIKIFKRKVKKIQAIHKTECDQFSSKNTQENKVETSVGDGQTSDTYLLTSTDQLNNNGSSQKKEQQHLKILSLRSLQNKIIPLYRGVEDIVNINNNEQLPSPKKSLSSDFILQSKIEPKGIQKNQSYQIKEKERVLENVMGLDQFKKTPLLKRFQKESRVASEQHHHQTLKDVNELRVSDHINKQKDKDINKLENSIQDYIFFREGKVLQQYENLQRQEKLEESTRVRVSSLPHQSSQKIIKQLCMQDINKRETPSTDINQDYKDMLCQVSQKRIYRIQSNVLKERRLSVLQDYKRVDFKDLTTSSSSSSSNSSLCTIRNVGGQLNIQKENNDQYPGNNLYNISPEKKSMKNIQHKVFPQMYKRNLQGFQSNKQNEISQQQRYLNMSDQAQEVEIQTVSSHTTKSYPRKDKNLQFFLSSQKKLIKSKQFWLTSV